MTTRRKISKNHFSGAHSENRCPDSNLNHRCRSAGRANCKPQKSRCENGVALTNCSVRYCCTQQYSITALTDSLGTIKERYAYDAYGGLSIFDGSGTARTSTAEGNRYTYTGREWDEVLGLYHYRARIYLSQLGRFGSRDPIGYKGSFLNLYRYVSCTPLNGRDPLGLADPVTVSGATLLFSCGTETVAIGAMSVPTTTTVGGLGAAGTTCTVGAGGMTTCAAGAGATATCGTVVLGAGVGAASFGVGYCISYYPSRACGEAACDIYTWWLNRDLPEPDIEPNPDPAPVDSGTAEPEDDDPSWNCKKLRAITGEPLCSDIRHLKSGNPRTACKECNPGCGNCRDWGGGTAVPTRPYFHPLGQRHYNCSPGGKKSLLGGYLGLVCGTCCKDSKKFGPESGFKGCTCQNK